MTASGMPVKSLGTTFDLIERIVERRGAGLAELADALDTPKSTVYDHLVTLQRLGYLIEEDGQYQLSTNFLLLGDMVRQDMRLYQMAKPELRRLADETGEHASLVIEEHGEAVLLATEKGEQAIPVKVFEGTRMTAHTAAPGKAMLAFLPDEHVDEVVDRHGLKRMTENTITSEADLLDELAWIREHKYALDDEERLTGMRSVAVPIIDRNDRVRGAITVYGPTNRIDDELFEEELPDRLMRAGNVIEILLNYE